MARSALPPFETPPSAAPQGEGQTLRRHAGPDRAAHAGAAEPAVAAWILGKILLVIVLGEVKRARVDDLGRDPPVAVRRERLFIHRLRILGGFALRRRGHINAGAV